MKTVTKTRSMITFFYTCFKSSYFPMNDLGNYDSPGVLKDTTTSMGLLHGFTGLKNQRRYSFY